MVIAIDVSPVLPGGENGGMKLLLWQLLKGFEKNAAADTFILLTSFKNDHIFREFEKNGMQKLCVIKDPGKKQHFLKRLLNRFLTGKFHLFNNSRNILNKKGISVLFCPFTAPTFSEIGIPTVSIVADLQHMYYPSFFSKQELNNRNYFYDQVKKKVDVIIAISSYTKETVIEKLKFSPEKVFALPIAIHSRLMIPPPDYAFPILEKFHLKGKTYCIYPANFWPHKNHKLLLTAFNIFQKKHPRFDLHLVLTGEKIAGDQVLEEAAKRMGIEEKVRFTGYLPERELAAVWRHSYFLVFPSLFEGFGIPLVEAMRYKRPILAGNTTSIPEVAEDAAIYFDPKKPDKIVTALYRIMTDKKLYDSLVKKGQKHLKKYDFDKMVDRYLDILHKVGEKKEGKNKVTVSGIFSDGWVGEKIQITFCKFQGERTFQLKGFLPGGHPNANMKIRVGKCSNSSRYLLRKKSELNIKGKLPHEKGKVNISPSKSFIPRSNDNRRLSFRVREFAVIDEKTGEKLYEFKQPDQAAKRQIQGEFS
jgi:glycosyltransferase involved in cell wall biosynthesis